jgi:hypothetical protein
VDFLLPASLDGMARDELNLGHLVDLSGRKLLVCPGE